MEPQIQAVEVVEEAVKIQVTHLSAALVALAS
jgi:hypothetical protein